MQTLLYFARIIRSFTVDFELFLLPKSRKYRHGTGRRCLLFYRREIGTHGHAHNLLNHYYNRNNRSGRIRPQRETSHVFDVSSPERRFGGSAKANSPVMKSGKISAEAELPTLCSPVCRRFALLSMIFPQCRPAAESRLLIERAVLVFQ